MAGEPNVELFYHGTKAGLKPGELVAPGHAANYGRGTVRGSERIGPVDQFEGRAPRAWASGRARNKNTYVYLTGTLDAAIWGAELALGDGPGRIYVVEPTGPIMDDPNLTNTRYPGNPTKSYRSSEPLRVTGEITDWQGHPPETIQAMKDRIKGLKPLDD